MTREYFRKDRAAGVTAPDLTKSCSVAEHVVRARGKRTNFTSVSLDLARLRDLGEAEYRLDGGQTEADGHRIIEHDVLISMLRDICQNSDKQERARALQAIRYAKSRLEALVEWKFDISAVARKDVIAWAYKRIQKYFTQI